MQLQTPVEVIDALGGTRAVANLTGRTYAAAFNWRKFERLPSNTFLVMRAALEQKGLNASPSLWGIQEPERAA